MTTTSSTRSNPVPPSLERLRDVAPYLRQWVETQVECRQVPGVQVAVRLGEDLVLSAGVGVADQVTGEELTTDHLFRVASHSKTFTAVAVMRLVEDGRLRLDDTVGQVLHDHLATPLASVTVRELLSHTSGAIRDGIDADFWQLEHPFPDADGLLAVVLDHGATYAPQEHFKYSNIGYGILGRIIERVTGQGYAEHVTAAVLDPLELNDTTPELTAEATGRAVRGHSRPFGRERARVPVDQVATGALAAATGFTSNAEDLSRFFAALVLGSPDLVSDHSRRLMHRAESTFDRGGGRASYGLGLIGITVGDRRMLGHSGGFPGQITRTLVDVRSGLVVSVLTNSVDGPAEAIAVGLVRLIDVLTRDAAGWQELPDGVTVEDLDRLTGRYHSLWGVVDVVRGGDRLVTLDPTTPSPMDDLEEMRALDATTLRPEDTDGFGGSGEVVPFELDELGRVRRMRITGVSSWPEDIFLSRRGEVWTRRS